MVPITVNAIEQSLVDQLQKAFPGVRVDSYPENPSTSTFIPTHASIYVRFHDKMEELPRDTNMVVQEATYRFVVTLLNRKLRASGGIYENLEIAELALRGFVPLPGCSKCWVGPAGYVEDKNGVWHYEVHVYMRATRVEDLDEAGAPRLTHITAIDQPGTGSQLDIQKQQDGSITITET